MGEAQNVSKKPDRYSVTEVKPGLWAIWDREHRCYWEPSRVKAEIEDRVSAYNADPSIKTSWGPGA